MSGFLQGFLIALFNPKILAWMLALYAPFIESDVSMQTLIGMGLLGMTIDGTWYVTVATVLTRGDSVEKLRSNSHIIDGAMGLLMFVFAGLLVTGALWREQTIDTPMGSWGDAWPGRRGRDGEVGWFRDKWKRQISYSSDNGGGYFRWSWCCYRDIQKNLPIDGMWSDSPRSR